MRWIEFDKAGAEEFILNSEHVGEVENIKIYKNMMGDDALFDIMCKNDDDEYFIGERAYATLLEATAAAERAAK